ncbi:MAG: hypothetical protein AVDCRST_MAG79-1743, partial [uncultured Thermoleophilia bacterium]
ARHRRHGGARRIGRPARLPRLSRPRSRRPAADVVRGALRAPRGGQARRAHGRRLATAAAGRGRGARRRAEPSDARGRGLGRGRPARAVPDLRRRVRRAGPAARLPARHPRRRPAAAGAAPDAGPLADGAL